MPRGPCSPSPVQISHKKVAAKGGHIDFMFLGPPPTRPLDPMLLVNHVFFFKTTNQNFVVFFPECTVVWLSTLENLSTINDLKFNKEPLN